MLVKVVLHQLTAAKLTPAMPGLSLVYTTTEEFAFKSRLMKPKQSFINISVLLAGNRGKYVNYSQMECLKSQSSSKNEKYRAWLLRVVISRIKGLLGEEFCYFNQPFCVSCPVIWILLQLIFHIILVNMAICH